MVTVSTPTGPVELTEKQYEVLNLAARHLNTKQIARDLDISPRTVQAHLDAARQRLDVATRAEAVQLLIDTPSETTCSPKRISEMASKSAEPFSPMGSIEFHDVGTFRESAPWEELSRPLSEFKPRYVGRAARVLLIVAIATLTMVLFGSGLMVVDVLAEMRT